MRRFYQHQLLSDVFQLDLDILSSIRPRVSRVFIYDDLEFKKKYAIDSLRRELTLIAIEEAKLDCSKLESELTQQVKVLSQKFSTEELLQFHDKVALSNDIIATKCLSSHKKKLSFHALTKNNFRVSSSSTTNVNSPSPNHARAFRRDTPINLSKRTKARKSESVNPNRKEKLRLRRKQQKKKKKEKGKLYRQNKVKEILDSRLVINYSSLDIPDTALIVLAKGAKFCMPDKIDKCLLHQEASSLMNNVARLNNKYDYERRLADIEETEETSFNDSHISSDCDKRLGQIHPRLRLPSSANHLQHNNNNLIHHLDQQFQNFITNVDLPDVKSNLTKGEHWGLKWLKRKTANLELVITPADKGGALLIVDGRTVDRVIRDDLSNSNKYQLLEGNPCESITTEIGKITEQLVDIELMDTETRRLTSGFTTKQRSTHPVFKMEVAYPYPLFKIHKQSEMEIVNKETPPHRLVHAMTAAPTTRSDIWVGDILTPISQRYCKNEYIKDTSDFLLQLQDVVLEPEEGYYLFTLDVKSLYPSIRPEIASQALMDVLTLASDFTEAEIQGFIYFAHYLMKNSVIQYKGLWYRAKEGIPTGGSSSRPVADCVMGFLMREVMETINLNNSIIWYKRFIDDLFGIFRGTIDQFRLFEIQLDTIASTYGLKFDVGDIGKSVNFLDVTVILDNTNNISTKLYKKPTDARNYLQFYSYHSHHVFRSVVYSQMLRVIRLTSLKEDQTLALCDFVEDFKRRGYPTLLLDATRTKVSSFSQRDLLLKTKGDDHKQDLEKVAILASKHSPFIPEAKKHFNNHKEDYRKINGVDRIMIATKKTTSIADLLFRRSHFSRVMQKETFVHQQCNHKRCQTCQHMSSSDIIRLDGKPLSLPKTACCFTNNVIYTAICIHCGDYYIGHTDQMFRDRVNKHRYSFNEGKENSSALAYHIKDSHPDYLSSKLHNFILGIIEVTSPNKLLRREQYFITFTRANFVGLNRHDAIRDSL